MSLYTEQAEIIEKRWPKIYSELQQVIDDENEVELIQDHELSLVFNQIPIASSYDQHKEALV